MARAAFKIVWVRNFLEALAKGSYSVRELSEITGVNYLTLAHYLRLFHKKPNLVYISRYKKTGPRGHVTACWSFGYMQEDAERPKPISPEEKRRRYYRNKLKKEGKLNE